MRALPKWQIFFYHNRIMSQRHILGKINAYIASKGLQGQNNSSERFEEIIPTVLFK